MAPAGKLNGLLLVAVCISLLAVAASDACVAQDLERQRLIEINDQMTAADAAKRHAELERLARTYLAIAERLREPRLMMVGHFWLGRGLAGQEKLQPAEESLKKSFELAQRHRPSFAPGVLDDLALVYQRLARYDDAEQAYQRALRDIQKSDGPDAPRLVKPLINLATLYQTLNRVDDADSQFSRAKQVLEKQPQTDSFLLQVVNYGLAVNRYKQFRYAESEQFYLKSIEFLERLPASQQQNLAHVFGGLHLLYRVTHRNALAEQAGTRSLAIATAAYGPEHSQTAHSLMLLSDFYREQGRFSESEALTRRAIEIRGKIFGRKHPFTAEAMESLASILGDQSRFGEALPLVQEAAEIFRAAFSETDDRVHRTTRKAGFLLGRLGRFEEGRAALHQALATVREDSFDASAVYVNLAQLDVRQQRFADAESLLLRSLKIKEDFPAIRKDDSRLSGTLAAIVGVYARQGKFNEAQPYSERLVAILDESTLARGELAMALAQRALIARGQSRFADARDDLLRAMEQVEEQRVQFSGGDFERSQAFGELTPIFESMVAMQVECGDMEETLAAMERGRARGFLDQLAIQGIDLFDRIPEEQVKKLQRRLTAAASQQAQARQQLQALDAADLAPAARERRQHELIAAVKAAQADYVATQSDIRNASPAYRFALGQDRRPISLATLQAFVAGQQALLLRYLIGADGSYVLIVPPSGAPWLAPLAVDDLASRQLGIPSGALTADRLNEAFSNESGDGVMQLFRQPRRAEKASRLTPKLAALWMTLIPDAARRPLVSGAYQRLLVVPDGALATLPFAALVVESGDEPVYALDVAPPILYAPSATILHNLAQRSETAERQDRQPVLTVGDPNYAGATAASESLVSPRARYGRLGGRLAPLPYSGLESQWVAEVFGRKGVAVGKLEKDSATEKNVVFNIPGRRVVHLACHGLADHTHGNLFGALAFTPQKSETAANDGLLTLSEIYGLDMRGCELTVLSACDTNFGPQQRGEAVWALSRGFLVAGSRRVVASNWMVDDKAAASLMSYYCSQLAGDTAQGKPPDYAGSLHAARRWVRQQTKWRSPYYWATFVHVGPN